MTSAFGFSIFKIGVFGIAVPALLCVGATTAARAQRLDFGSTPPDAALIQTAPPGGKVDARPPQANPPAVHGADARARPLNEGFEQVAVLGGGLYAGGWIRQNNSDAPWSIWFRGRADVFNAFDGPAGSFIVQNWYATNSDYGRMSSWLLTPPVNFTADSVFSFYTRTSEGAPQADRLQVRVCGGGDCSDVGTQPDDIGAFDRLVLDINPGEQVGGYPESWTRYTVTAAEGLPSSGSGRLAFRYFLHQNDGVLRGNYIGIDRVVLEQSENAPSPIDLAVTVTRADPAAPDACGGTAEIDVAVGDQVNLCYRVTNRTNAPLRHHWLRDDQAGAIFDQRELELAPGASHQYNRIVTVSQPQTLSATWTAQADPPGYRYDDSQPADFIDITDGEVVPVDASAPFPEDFDFKLYGERVDRICVAHYGLISSAKGPWCPGYAMHIVAPGAYPQRLPENELTIAGTSLALYWTTFAADGYEIPSGTVFQKTIGEAPNRKYVVEYHQQQVSSGSPAPERGLTAQVVLNETSNLIEFQYDNVVFGGNPGLAYGGNASIGLQRYDQAQPYSFRTPSLQHVSRIAWTPSDPTVHTRTRIVRIGVQTPTLSLDATPIEVAVPVGGRVDEVLQIANTGDGRLDWSAGAAATNRHMPATPRPLAVPATDAPFGVRAEHDAAPALALPVGTPRAADPALALWGFDVGAGYLVVSDPAQPGYAGNAAIKASFGARLIAGADFLDDDFGALYAFDTTSRELLRYAPIDTAAGVIAGEHRVGRAIGLPVGSLASGLKQDPTTGAVYLATADGQASQLWRIDPATAAVWPVGGIDGAVGLISLEFDNDGNLYGLDVVLDALFAIDKSSGHAQAIGPLGLATGGMFSALAFDPMADTLYLATIVQEGGAFPAGSAMFVLDRQTGAASWAAPITGLSGSGAQFGALAFARRGVVCTQAVDIPWLSLSTGGGTIAVGASPTPLTLTFDASGLADGVYRANLCVHSNDPLHLRTALPLSFIVGDGDRVFADGFDGAQP